MAPNDYLLDSLCRDQETLDEARSVLRLASQKTGPGSGHELGALSTGLPAICAYIASQRLNNGEVSRKNAQIASCLKASDFEKAFYAVQAAIGGSRRKTGVSEDYDTLIRQYKPSVDRGQLINWLNAAGRALIQSDSRLNPDDPNDGFELKCVIFFWTFNVFMGKTVSLQQQYAEDHNIPVKTFSKLLKKVGDCCSSLKTRIQTEATKRDSPVKTATTPRRSPAKPALRVLPSKDSPSKRKASASEHDQLNSDIDMLDAPQLETPIKKRKSESPSKPTARISPIKPIFPPIASSSRTTLDDEGSEETTHEQNTSPVTHTPGRSKFRGTTVQFDADTMDIDDPPRALLQPDDSDEDERPTRRRFRPVYSDHKQWYGIDKRLKRIWKQVERHKENILESGGQHHVLHT